MIIKKGQAIRPYAMPLKGDNRPFVKRHSEGCYRMANLFLGTLFFVIPYFAYISKLPKNLDTLLIIFGWNVLSGILASIFCRAVTGYWGAMNKSSKEIYTGFFQSILYSIIIWLGMIASIFEAYQVEITSLWDVFLFFGMKDFYELLAVLFLVKAFIFLLSDYFSTRLLIG